MRSDNDSSLLFWATCQRITFGRDWLVSFANRNKEGPLTGKLWLALLQTYGDKHVIRGATQWALECGMPHEDTIDVLECLLFLYHNPKLIDFAKQLLLQVPANSELYIHLLDRLIRCTEDDEVTQLGEHLLEKADPNSVVWTRGCCSQVSIAGVLLRRNNISLWTTVEAWLRKCSNPRPFLSHLTDDVSVPIASLIFEWIITHGYMEIAALQMALIKAFTYKSSSELRSITWRWVRTQTDIHSALIDALVRTSRDQETLDEAIEIALATLEKYGSYHTNSGSIICSLLSVENRPEWLDLARKWLANNSNKGLMLWNLLRDLENEEVQAWALDWLQGTPDSGMVGNVLLELLRRQPTDQVVQMAKAAIRTEKYLEDFCFAEFRVPAISLELVKLGDEESIIRGKDFLNRQPIEFFWWDVRQPKEKMLEALLIGAPSDHEVLEYAKQWLATEVDMFERYHDETDRLRVREAYQKALTIAR